MCTSPGTSTSIQPSPARPGRAAPASPPAPGSKSRTSAVSASGRSPAIAAAGRGRGVVVATTMIKAQMASLLRGAARAWWPIRSSKPAGRRSPAVGRFDSFAAPFGSAVGFPAVGRLAREGGQFRAFGPTCPEYVPCVEASAADLRPRLPRRAAPRASVVRQVPAPRRSPAPEAESARRGRRRGRPAAGYFTKRGAQAWLDDLLASGTPWPAPGDGARRARPSPMRRPSGCGGPSTSGPASRPR